MPPPRPRVNAFRLALIALLPAVAAGAAGAQPLAQALMPIAKGPAGPGQCVLGVDGCGAGPGIFMDPETEGALIGLGEPSAPGAAAAGSVANSTARPAPAAANAPLAPDEADAVAQLGVGIGGIINPTGGLVALKGSRAAAGPATVGAAFGRSASVSTDPTSDAGPQDGAQNFSFLKMRKAAAAAALTEKEVPSPESKLAPGDDELRPETSGATSNGKSWTEKP